MASFPTLVYEIQRTTVPAGSALHLFSDGVFEIVTKNQQRWALSDFLPLIPEPVLPGTSEPERLYRAVNEATGAGALEDDFSLVVAVFQ